MNAYKKIILSLSLLTLITPAENICTGHKHICGEYIHVDGIISSAMLTIPWLLWIGATSDGSEINAGWHSPHKEGFFRSISSASLVGAGLLGATKLLFCFGDAQSLEWDGYEHSVYRYKTCSHNTTYPDAFTWMKIGAVLGAVCGLGRWAIYNTPEHSIQRAEELSEMPTYQENRINTGMLLFRNEPQFWNEIEATYCTNKYPLVSANYAYEIIEKRLSRIIQYLDKATKNGASTLQLIVMQELRDKTINKMTVAQTALVAIKRHPNYYNQVQAHTQDKIAATQEKMLAEQRWNNLRQSFRN